MDTDGVQGGFDLALTKAVREATRVPVIASGGAGSSEDFRDVLQIADAALAASVFHFGSLTIGELKNFLADQHIVVRR